MQKLDTLWNGKESEYALNYNLKVKGDELLFSVVFPDDRKVSPNAVKGMFTPELWKWDVAEVFIMGEKDVYLELNLAPNSAWWVQGFNEVRVTDPAFNLGELQITAQEEGAQVSLSLKGLSKYLGDPLQWRGNVTAILNAPQYAFLSAIQLPGKEADFHQPSSFPLLLDLFTS